MLEVITLHKEDDGVLAVTIHVLMELSQRVLQLSEASRPDQEV
jgi:hypothetical protein